MPLQTISASSSRFWSAISGSSPGLSSRAQGRCEAPQGLGGMAQHGEGLPFGVARANKKRPQRQRRVQLGQRQLGLVDRQVAAREVQVHRRAALTADCRRTLFHGHEAS